MTKVSWKRILQRAGNDLPASGRPYTDRPHVIPLQRAPRAARSDSPRGDESPRMAGELESELRRALQRAQPAPVADSKPQGWDPVFMAQELHHNVPVSPVPAAHYAQLQQRSSKTARNLIVLSLSAAVVGLAIQQFSEGWRDSDGDGGGGGNGGGGQYRSADQASVGVPLRAKEQGQVVQTGYAIQPMLNSGNSTDLAPVEEAPRGKSNLLPQQPSADTAAAAASFKRDMEEARKMFERSEDQPGSAVRPASTAKSAAEPAANIASVAPARTAAPEADTALAPSLSEAEQGKMMQRASDLMQRGDITGARLLFEHLARRGSAIGAFALAQSYDQKYLQKLYVRGLTADQQQAAYWYRRAAELSSPDGSDNGKFRR